MILHQKLLNQLISSLLLGGWLMHGIVLIQIQYRCFRRAGILNREMDVVARGTEEDVDPFDDLDTEGQMQDLISTIMPTAEACTAGECISRDDSVAVCAEYADDAWEESFFAEIGESSQMVEEEEEEERDEESSEV